MTLSKESDTLWIVRAWNILPSRGSVCEYTAWAAWQFWHSGRSCLEFEYLEMKAWNRIGNGRLWLSSFITDLRSTLRDGSCKCIFDYTFHMFIQAIGEHTFVHTTGEHIFIHTIGEHIFVHTVGEHIFVHTIGEHVFILWTTHIHTYHWRTHIRTYH